MASGIFIVGLLVGAVVLFILLRKKFFQLLIDLAVGTLIYLALIFVFAWFNVRVPTGLGGVGYLACLCLIVGWHVVSNINMPVRGTRPYGSL